MLISEITKEYNYSGIYIILNLVNKKIYIGQSQNIYLRIKAHINGKHNKYLSRAFEKYGLDKFDIQILEKCEIEELDKKEQYWIDFYKATDKTIGYNICPVAGSTRGVQKSKEERDRLREIAKSRVGNKNAFYGKHHNKSTKEAIRKKKTGIKYSVEQRENVSSGHIGLLHSKETKSKISKSLTGKAKTNKHKENISRSQLGHNVTDQTKIKISKSMKENKNRNYEDISKGVKQIDKHTNEVLMTFDSIIQAARYLGHDNCVNIMNVCKHKPHCKTAYGYKWEYI